MSYTPKRLRVGEQNRVLRAQAHPTEEYDEDRVLGYVEDPETAREIVRRYNAASPEVIDAILKELLGLRTMLHRTNLVDAGFGMIDGIRDKLLLILDGRERQ